MMQRTRGSTAYLRTGLAVAAALAAAHLWPGASVAQAQRLPVVTDFVDIREVIDVQLSRDGRWIAYVLREVADSTAARALTHTAVYVVPADGSASPRRLSAPGATADLPRWRPDSRALSYVAPGPEGRRQLLLHPLDGTAASLGDLRTAITRYAWSGDGSSVALVAAAPPDTAAERRRRAGYDVIVADEPGGGGARLWMLDVAAGTARSVSDPALNVRDVAWSPDGRELAVVAGTSEGARLLVLDRSGAVQRTLTQNAGGTLTRRQILDWSPDGRTILFAYTRPAPAVGHWLGLVPAAGGPVRELLRDFEGSVMRAMWLPDSRHLIAQTFEDLTSRLLRIDTRDGRFTAVGEVLSSYPRMSVSGDGRTIAYAGQEIQRPAEVWVKRGAAAARRITDHNPQLAGLLLGEVRPFRWSHPDGTRLSGVLVTPPGHDPGRPYPTVVHLHGGPHFHWGIGWLGDWHDWAQLLAANGFVVLLPNPRGSTGRSWEFASAIVGDLGGIDVEDVLAGVDALVEAGIADPERLGVGGFSYGGFLTAATVTQTQRFRAAVVAAGITNFFSFVTTPGNGLGWGVSFFPDHLHNRPEAYHRSPTSHLRRVTTPTLVLHGEQDSRIRVDQGWEFYHGLRLLGIEAQMVVYPRAGHGITERAHQIDYLTRIVGWFDRHLRGGQGRLTSERE